MPPGCRSGARPGALGAAPGFSGADYPGRLIWFGTVTIECCMAEPRSFHLATITDSTDIRLTPGFRLYLREAAQFCLDHNGHSDGQLFQVDGSYRRLFRLRWIKSPDLHRHTFADTAEAVENGAYGVAFALILSLTRHNVIERSAKGPGFDFWLGDRGALGFQRSARLEVSGILSNESQIVSRTARKVAQTRRSDFVNLPVYVVIVEFGRPMSRITRR